MTLRSITFIHTAIFVGTVSFTGLTACANSTPPVEESTAEMETEAATTETEPVQTETDHSAPKAGGQVVEAGNYHMEFVPVPEADGVHLDFYLQTGDDHAAIPGATVTAQVQLPDGSQQEVAMEYDAEGEHYFAFLPSQSTGEYKVVVQTDVNGEKTNGRFTFTQ